MAPACMTRRTVAFGHTNALSQQVLLRSAPPNVCVVCSATQNDTLDCEQRRHPTSPPARLPTRTGNPHLFNHPRGSICRTLSAPSRVGRVILSPRVRECVCVRMPRNAFWNVRSHYPLGRVSGPVHWLKIYMHYRGNDGATGDHLRCLCVCVFVYIPYL